MMDHRGLDHLPDDALGEDDDDFFERSRRRVTRVDGGRRSVRTRLILWLVLPIFCAAGLVLFGVHLGAQYPDAWYTRAVAWLVETLSGV